MTQEEPVRDLVESSKYLIFQLCGERFGMPLTDLTEVIERREAKRIPNMVKYFDGIINLQGKVVGVIKLHEKLGMKNPNKVDQLASLIVETENGIYAVNFDKIDSVREVSPSMVDRRPAIPTKIPKRFLMGVAKFEDALITLVDIRRLLSEESLLSYHDSKFVS